MGPRYSQSVYCKVTPSNRSRIHKTTVLLSSVAKKILDMKSHQVNLGESECIITVEARPVQLMVPRVVEVQLKTLKFELHL